MAMYTPRGSDCTNERRVLDVRRKIEDLTRLEVDRHLDDQPRVRVEFPVGRVQGERLYRLQAGRMRPA